MSEFFVHHEHINVLLWAARTHTIIGSLTWYYDNPTRMGQLTLDVFDEVGQMLVDANADSVNNAQQPLVAPSAPCEFRFKKPLHTGWSLTELFNALDGYVYQSCNATDWKTSEAYAFCDALRSALICALPGYNNGPWAITPSSEPLRPRTS